MRVGNVCNGRALAISAALAPVKFEIDRQFECGHRAGSSSLFHLKKHRDDFWETMLGKSQAARLRRPTWTSSEKKNVQL